MHGSALGCMLYISRRQSVSGVLDSVYWRIVVVVSKYSDFIHNTDFCTCSCRGGGILGMVIIMCTKDLRSQVSSIVMQQQMVPSSELGHKLPVSRHTSWAWYAEIIIHSITPWVVYCST